MGINYVNNLKEFVESWDKERILPESDSDMFRKSSQGNINIDGTASSFKALVLTRSHPRFEEAIEEGVKKLVLALIKKFNCVTYSSCQGHFSSEDGVPMRQRQVQILPRSKTEYDNLLTVLTNLTNNANSKVVQNSVKLSISDDILESENIKLSCLRIIFNSLGENEKLYFQEVESLYDYFVNLISLEDFESDPGFP